MSTQHDGGVDPSVTNFGNLDSLASVCECLHTAKRMLANYQDLLIHSLLLVSVLELALCLIAGAVDKRSIDPHRPDAATEPEILDPFATWINMLERQKDRRDGARYDGIERRSKISYS